MMAMERAWHDAIETASDYHRSREAFRSAAARIGWAHESAAIDARDRDGNELTIDVAVSTTESSERAIVVSSGLHGVEAPLGAAIQLLLVREQRELSRIASAAKLVFLHALNPFGFAFGRRVNEDNVDLNRNFLTSGESYAGHPDGYARLNRLLNPQSPPTKLDWFYGQAALAVLREGMPALKQAVAAGQYDFPRGLFFGGQGPSATQRVLESLLPRLVSGCRDVIHLDFHTGLGRFASYKLLLDDDVSESQFAELAGRFGAESLQRSHVDGVAYRARGTLGPWCRQLLAGCNYRYLCAEFGTYGPLRMLAGLRAENAATQWAGEDSFAVERARRRLRELFCPPSSAWWSATLKAGLELIEKAASRRDSAGPD
jgi:predicted deacylase